MISNNEHERDSESTAHNHRALRVENLEDRNLFAVDLDDSLSEARPLGAVSEQPMTTAAEISESTDVDMFRVTLAGGQSIDIDVDTPTNGPGGLGGYLRVFNEQGIEVASNNDAMSPDDGSLGFDPYIKFTAQQNGNYYIAVSNWENTNFDPLGGEGDVAGQQYATGSYSLTVKGVPQFDSDDAINEATSLGATGPTHYSVDGVIDSDVDVDMFRIDMMNGQSVEFDIDTTLNGPGGLGSYLTLFDANGNMVASNNDGAAPGENIGFDAYLRLSVVTGGPYYLAVSNYGNTTFSPVTGNGDTAGSMYATGAYRLTIGEVLPGAMAMSADNQAAPMIDSGASIQADSMASGGDTVLSSNAIGTTSQMDVRSDISAVQQFGLPPIASPMSAFGTFDANASSAFNSAAFGSSVVNIEPGQPALNEQVDTRTAVATDLALMQSI